MLIEMHCHTSEHSSCSIVPALELVRQVFSRGLHGIVLTDHHYLWDPEELETLRRAAALPTWFRIMAAQEVSVPGFGDVLVYGAGESFGAGTSAAEICRRYPQAALVWAHPFRNGRRPTAERLLDPLLDGVEIFNSNHTARENRQALDEWHRLRFTATAGTDTHAAGYAAVYPTMFDHPVTDVAELAAEIRGRRCRPHLSEIPRDGANNLVTELTIGIPAPADPSGMVVVKASTVEKKWQAAQRGFEIMRGVYESGFSSGPFRVPRPLDRDPEGQTVVEERLPGRSLYDTIRGAPPERRLEYLGLAAGWLAKLHGMNLRLTPPESFAEVETRKLARYVEYFQEASHPHTEKARALMEVLREEEERHIFARLDLFTQGHGDFHPKNIFVVRERGAATTGTYLAAIDFDSSYCQPRAFDVGYFLAQFRHQFWDRSDILAGCPEAAFIDAYLAAAPPTEADFLRKIELFRSRTCLNVASFLVWIGRGDSPDVWRLLVEGERAAARWGQGETSAN